MPELFDVVELTVDLPSFSLYASMQGTVIEVHEGANGMAYEVEFSNEEGEATNWLALRPEQIVVVWQARTEKWLPLSERVAAVVARLPESAGSQVFDFARFLNVRLNANKQQLYRQAA